MNIAICDDDCRFRELLEKHIRNYFNEKSMVLNIIQFPSGEAILSEELLFDIVFLDIEMDELNGIETGKALKAKNPQSIIFIVTSHENYLDDAFRINAFRFLSKPLDIVRLFNSLDDAVELLKNDLIAFYDVESKSNVRVYTKDIILIEIKRKKTKVVTNNNCYYSNERISFWKNKLNGISFVCPHSSYIVNLDYSINHTRTEIILARRDALGNIVEKYTVQIAPKKQALIKRQFFIVLERR